MGAKSAPDAGSTQRVPLYCSTPAQELLVNRASVYATVKPQGERVDGALLHVDVAAAALHLAQIGHELFAAARQIPFC